LEENASSPLKKYCVSNVFVLEHGQFLEHSEYPIKTMP